MKSIIEAAIEQHKEEAIALLQQLIRIPSINHPPTGDEKQIQEFYYNYLRETGLPTELLEPNEVAGFLQHPAMLADHDMRNRPNVVGTLKGQGESKSLLLISHCDTELSGKNGLWTNGDPFSGARRDGRIYGRGSGDDKAGMAISAVIPKILASAGIQLQGDLIIASVSDEEQGGSNGAVALICKNYEVDACINLDGLNQDICIANLGGGSCKIQINAKQPQQDASAVTALFNKVYERIKPFKKNRVQQLNSHPCYADGKYSQSAVRVMNVCLGPLEQLHHGELLVWLYMLPGEKPAQLKAAFEQALYGLDLTDTYQLEWMQRFLPASEIKRTHELVNCLSEAFVLATDRQPITTGATMSDMGFINEFGNYPCVMYGISQLNEGGPHQPDEFIEICDFIEAIRTTIICTMKWCGYSKIKR
jgi:acetylornithine deacetylase